MKERQAAKLQKQTELKSTTRTLLSFFPKFPMKSTEKVCIDLIDSDSGESSASKIDSQLTSDLRSYSDISHLKKRSHRIRAWHTSNRKRMPDLKHVKKLLQFHENNRPPFYGLHSTSKTKSSAVRHCRRGRRPLFNLSWIDYDHDSDEDWEEEDPGESLSGAEDGEEDNPGDDELDYTDHWLAYENEIDYADENDERLKQRPGNAEGSRENTNPSGNSSHKFVRDLLGPYVAACDNGSGLHPVMTKLSLCYVRAIQQPRFHGACNIVSGHTIKAKSPKKNPTPSIKSFFARK